MSLLLLFLTQVSISGSKVALTASEVSGVSEWVIAWSSSILNIIIQILPIILVVVVLLCIRRILVKLWFFEKTAFGRWLSK